MPKQTALTITAVLLLCCFATASETEDQVRARIGNAAAHPRLLMSAADDVRIRGEIAAHETKQSLFALIRKQADSILDETPVIRKKSGKRLLSVSREALRRILSLCFVYRVTGESDYAARAVREMEAVTAFSDWNPSHFLDVAEMTAALAIGYDWLLPLLTEEQEASIRTAIIEKGIAPSFNGHDSWAFRDNNWNQVCHAGLMMGALAVLEHDPELAVRVIARALDGLPHAMKSYQPDGVYPEGPSYWEYGTTYNVLGIAALESALATDFGLVDFPGFHETGAFPLYMTGPTGNHFTFSDCGSRNRCFPAVYWFARRLDDPGLFHLDHPWLEKALRGEASAESRFLPLLLLWWDGRPSVTPSQPLHWKGEGKNPVTIHRTSWTDPNAVFLAVKGGTPSANHGHMDIGSFILEADDTRWAVDIMGRGYGDLEARGLNLWNMSQDSDRWRIYRYHNSSHNTLTVNKQGQRVKGRGDIKAFSADPANAFTILDLKSVYEGQLSEAARGFRLLPDGRVLVQDEITAGDTKARVCWAMTTPAEMTKNKSGSAVLTHNGQRLFIDVLSPSRARLQYFSTEPREDWDLATPDIRQVGFHVKLSKGETETLAVLLTPGSRETAREAPPELCPLAKWGKP